MIYPSILALVLLPKPQPLKSGDHAPCRLVRAISPTVIEVDLLEPSPKRMTIDLEGLTNPPRSSEAFKAAKELINAKAKQSSESVFRYDVLVTSASRRKVVGDITYIVKGQDGFGIPRRQKTFSLSRDLVALGYAKVMSKDSPFALLQYNAKLHANGMWAKQEELPRPHETFYGALTGALSPTTFRVRRESMVGGYNTTPDLVVRVAHLADLSSSHPRYPVSLTLARRYCGKLKMDWGTVTYDGLPMNFEVLSVRSNGVIVCSVNYEVSSSDTADGMPNSFPRNLACELLKQGAVSLQAGARTAYPYLAEAEDSAKKARLGIWAPRRKGAF